MKKIGLLDVTLRDGGHRMGFKFSEVHLNYLLTKLNQAQIPFVEVGYRNGFLQAPQALGDAGLCPLAYLKYCRAHLTHAIIAVMVHPPLIGYEDLVELKHAGVQLIRFCIARHQFKQAHDLIIQAKRLNLMISLNFIHVSQYSSKALDEVVTQAASLTPDMIYFADSNGHLTPQAVKAIYTRFISRFDCQFGFHPHDNLGLAQANALAALEVGVHMIDSSLAGMGKGTGNLKTEFWTAYLNAYAQQTYHLESICEAANYLRQQFSAGFLTLTMDEFRRGIEDLSTAELKQLKLKEMHDVTV
ncbi:MAG: 4-hydroxy-2-oxovalerate aldolase [Legionellaceae bacterium]|nr:4-hydroxy-2-oxovalerate aldolase [Legionellaceae bacterium]HCA90109.1 4-hydroxy-2-oxovalerate aldolase [Legionellales bacterium]